MFIFAPGQNKRQDVVYFSQNYELQQQRLHY